MAQGKQLGEFKLTSTSTTFTPGPGTAITVQVNFEGAVTGETGGQHRGTLVGFVANFRWERARLSLYVTYAANA
jgi:hypothetical protein